MVCMRVLREKAVLLGLNGMTDGLPDLFVRRYVDDR